ncbi:MAG: hypothetical protein R3279_08360 [Putridiphycobacter sp.]|nr:hypothetical protein [Putridiphycobacter sp.]
MTHIPKRIIGLDKADVDKAKASFLKWSSGKSHGVEFMTLKEAMDQKIQIEIDQDFNPENELTELAKHHV